MTSSCIVLTTSEGHWPGPSLYKFSWDDSKHAFEPFACNCMLASYQRVPISVTAIKLDVSRSFHDMYKHMQRMSNDIYISKTYIYLCGKLWDVISYPWPRYLLLAPMYDTYNAPKSSCVCDTYTAPKSPYVCDTCTAPKFVYACDTYTAPNSYVCDSYTAPKSSYVCDTNSNSNIFLVNKRALPTIQAKIKTHTHTKSNNNNTMIQKWKTWRDDEIWTRVPGVGARTSCIQKTSYDSYITGTLLNETHWSYIHVRFSRNV